MSQLSSKPPPTLLARPPNGHGPGTCEGVAGFRMGRGRDPRTAQDGQQAHQGQQAPYGQQGPYGRPAAPPHGQWQAPQQYGAAQQGGQGEPEYFGDGGYDP